MKCRRAAGFTLLELLLAISLAALLLTLLSAGFRSVIREWVREESGLSRLLDQSLLLRQIEQALTGAWPHLYEKDLIFFVGREDAMAWVSTVSPDQSAGLTCWRLQGEPGGGVRLTASPALTGDPLSRLTEPEQETEPAFFTDHNLRLAYLAPAKPGEEPQWLPEWNGEEMRSLPLAVHLRLEADNGNARESHELIVPIPAREHPRITSRSPL